MLVFVVDFGDIRAATHLHRYQTFGGQDFECLTQRGAADAIFLGQTHFVDPTAGCQFTRENPLTQEFSDFFVQRARGEGQGRHGQILYQNSILNS